MSKYIPSVVYHFHLGASPALLSAVQSLVQSEQKNGNIPERELPTGSEHIFFIGSEEAPIAFATFYQAQPELIWLDILYVSPEHRRKGHGARLVAMVRSIAQDNGMKSIALGTLTGNEAMLTLAKTFGFKIEAHLLSIALGDAHV